MVFRLGGETGERDGEGVRSVEQQVAMLGAQGYLLKAAIESGKIQFMVVPPNGNVSIPVPTPVPTPR
jgi:hypothetical protein